MGFHHPWKYDGIIPEEWPTEAGNEDALILRKTDWDQSAIIGAFLEDYQKYQKGQYERKERVNMLGRNGQNHGFARAIEISRFFRDLILVDASGMNNTVGFIFISASKQFLFVLVCF
jgi:hypothetical protein